MTKTTTVRAPAPSRTPFLTRTPRPEGLPDYFLCVREAEAGKLGLRAHGSIRYQTLLDPERRRVFLRVVANSGSGSFSDEPVHVDKLAQAVANRDAGKPLRGSVLQSAIVGKSVCNAGFFAAVLVAEGLLGRDKAKRFDLLDLERWQTWTAEQLAADGELTEVRLKAEGIDPKKEKLVAVGKVAKGKGLVIAPAQLSDDTAVGAADAGAGDISNADDGETGRTGDVVAIAAAHNATPTTGSGEPESVTSSPGVDHGEPGASKGRRRGKNKE